MGVQKPHAVVQGRAAADVADTAGDYGGHAESFAVYDEQDDEEEDEKVEEEQDLAYFLSQGYINDLDHDVND